MEDPEVKVGAPCGWSHQTFPSWNPKESVWKSFFSGWKQGRLGFIFPFRGHPHQQCITLSQMWCQWISAAKTEIPWQESLLKTTSIFNNVQPFPGWNGWNDWNGWNGWNGENGENLPFPSFFWLNSSNMFRCGDLPWPVTGVGATFASGATGGERAGRWIHGVLRGVQCARRGWHGLCELLSLVPKIETLRKIDGRWIWSSNYVKQLSGFSGFELWNCRVVKWGSVVERVQEQTWLDYIFCEALDDSCSFSNLNFSERYPTRAPFFDVSGNAVWY